MTKPIDLTEVVADLIKRVEVLEAKLTPIEVKPIPSREPREVNVNVRPAVSVRNSQDKPTSEKLPEPAPVDPEILVEEPLPVTKTLS